MRLSMKSTLTLFLLASVTSFTSCIDQTSQSTTAFAHLSSERACSTSSPELPIVSLPADILLDPQQLNILVCQPELGRILQTEIATGKCRVVTTGPNTPWGITPIHGSPLSLVVDTKGDCLYLLNPATGMEQELKQPFPGSPLEAACTADGNWCHVLISTGKIARLPLTGGEGNIINPVLEDPWGLVLEASGLTALVCERSPGRVVRVWLADGSLEVLTDKANSPTDLLIEPGGTTALVVCADGDIQRLDLQSGNLSTVTTLAGGTTITHGRSSGEVLVADHYSGKIFALDPVTGNASILVEGISEPTWLKTPDGNTLALVDQTRLGGVYRVDLDGVTATPVLLLEDGSDLTSLAVSMDATSLFASTITGKLFQIPLNGTPATTLTTGLLAPGALCPATNGTDLYLAEHQTAGGSEYASLAKLNLNTNQLTGLTSFTIPYTVHGITHGASNQLLVRDDQGMRTFSLTFNQLSPFYTVPAPAITDLVTAWPHSWVAWYDQDLDPEYRIYTYNFNLNQQTLVASGKGVQPIGMALSHSGHVLYVADMVAAAIVRFTP